MTKYEDWRKEIVELDKIKYGVDITSSSKQLELLVRIDVAESLSIICQHLDSLRNPNRSG